MILFTAVCAAAAAYDAAYLVHCIKRKQTLPSLLAVLLMLALAGAFFLML